jgi:ribose/xylose/arabinose/galactoside ABC-type transport system permease subunit
MTRRGPGADPSTTDLHGVRMSVKIAVVESAASWLVRRAMEAGYRAATGQDPPTARNQAAPLQRILVWASVSAAGVAAANVLADRLVLRHEPTPDAVGRDFVPDLD